MKQQSENQAISTEEGKNIISSNNNLQHFDHAQEGDNHLENSVTAAELLYEVSQTTEFDSKISSSIQA